MRRRIMRQFFAHQPAMQVVNGNQSPLVAALWPIKNNPGSEIAAEVFKSMCNSSRDKDRVARLERLAFVAEHETPGARLHNVDFVLFVRVLRIDTVGFVKSHFKRSMLQ
jgi:hypothetical protein